MIDKWNEGSFLQKSTEMEIRLNQGKKQWQFEMS